MITPEGSYKPWREMTADERQQDRLRHFKTFLARWRGARAILWELTTGHKTLTIRLERCGSSENLHVSCYPVYIRGPVTWSNCDIEISLTDTGKWMIEDVAAGLEIRGEGLEMRENCTPRYVAV